MSPNTENASHMGRYWKNCWHNKENDHERSPHVAMVSFLLNHCDAMLIFFSSRFVLQYCRLNIFAQEKLIESTHSKSTWQRILSRLIYWEIWGQDGSFDYTILWRLWQRILFFTTIHLPTFWEQVSKKTMFIVCVGN